MMLCNVFMLGAFSKKSQSAHSHKTKISMEPVYSKFIKLTKCEIIHLHVHIPYIYFSNIQKLAC